MFSLWFAGHRHNRDEGCEMLAEAARLYDEMDVPGGAQARATARKLGCEG